MTTNSKLRAAAIGALLMGGLTVVGTEAATQAAATQAAQVSGVRYVDRIFSGVAVTGDITYAVAPGLITGIPETLQLDLYQPTGDTLTSRPTIVFIHGGGFKGGDKRLDATTPTAYAERGFVAMSINYRLDRGNRCQDVQDGKIPDPAEAAAESARCETAIKAAQYDSQAAVRWIRANAASLGVDPTRIGVIGFSAGAVTAANLAYRSQDPGDVGDNDSQDSRVQAAISASGCNYDQPSIGAGDAPMLLLHAEFDGAVPFACAVATASAASAAGLPVETMFYYGESTHARSLYEKYRSDADARWIAFLDEHLALGLGLGRVVSAGSKTVIHGLPNRSAVVSVVMTENFAPAFVQVLACDAAPGSSSNLNADRRLQTRAGLAIVRFDASGRACLYNSASTHLVADLQGYLTDSAVDDIADVRLLDSRLGGAAPIQRSSTTMLTGRPNSTAVLSIVVVDTAGPGYLQALPCASAPGGYSNLNAARSGQTIANLAFVRFDGAGHACIYNQPSTHLVVDLQAYLTDGAFDDIDDARALDTRSGSLPPGGTQTTVTGRANSTAVMSMIATQTAGPGYVQALACGATPGESSNLNVDSAGQTIANLGVVAFSPAGTLCLFNQNPTHLVADVQGYLAPGAFTDAPDVRLLDTRG